MKRSGGVYAVRFFRLCLFGLSALLVIFVPVKLLQFMGLGSLLTPVHNFVTSLGLPSMLGYFATVIAAFAVLVAVGWVLMFLIRTQHERLPFLALFTRTVERFDDLFARKGGAKPMVALIAWPNENVRTVGVLFRHDAEAVKAAGHAAVFIPNSPNPMGGILRMVSVESLEYTDWTMDDVLALTVSRGALMPKGPVPGQTRV